MMAKRFALWKAAAPACAALACALLASRASAQQAVVEIAGIADKKDPHPVTYHWEGDNKPVTNPVQFYSYFYTGTIQPDATVGQGVTVQRIAIPNNEWESIRQTIVTRLRSFYEEAYHAVQTTTQNNVQFDENFNYVETAPKNQNPGAVDPRAAAEWMFYYDQFVLWQFYCKRTLLNDRDAEKASSPRDELELESQRKSLEGRDDLNVPVEDVLKAVKELKESEKGGGKDKNAAAAPKGPNDREVATEFDPEADYADPHHNDVFRDEFLQLAEKREKEATKTFTDMLQRIEARADETARFQEWLKEKKVSLRDFATAWSKVRDGETLYLDDVFYILSKERIEDTPRGAVNSIVRDVTTPSDLIGKDGKLKKPAED